MKKIERVSPSQEVLREHLETVFGRVKGNGKKAVKAAGRILARYGKSAQLALRDCGPTHKFSAKVRKEAKRIQEEGEK